MPRLVLQLKSDMNGSWADILSREDGTCRASRHSTHDVKHGDPLKV